MRYLIRCQLLLWALVLLPLAARAQTPGAVGIGTTTPAASAALEVKATDKGLLPPRMTSAQRAAISSPATGLLVYQTDGTPGYYYYSGTAWVNLSTGTSPEAGGTLAPPSSYGFVTTLAMSQELTSNPNGLSVDARGTVTLVTYDQVLSISPGGTVTVVAGAGPRGYRDGPAATALFDGLLGLAIDGQGRIYVSDIGNHCIRLIENGQVSTWAGTTTPGFRDGPVAAAQFNAPCGLAFDAQGRLYVADNANHCIRRIENGQVTTVAGSSGAAGYQDGPAATARFNAPLELTFDAQGRLYIVDEVNRRIRVLDNGQVSTLVGTGAWTSQDGPVATASVGAPYGVVVDRQGRVYFSDGQASSIRVVENGRVSTLAGTRPSGLRDGPGATAQFQFPGQLTLDPQGTLYLSDYNNYKIRRIGGATTALPSLALSGQELVVSGGNSVTLPTGDNLGSHLATQPLRYNTLDADKLLFTPAGAAGAKLEHGAGSLLNYYAGPNNALAGTHRFLTGTATGWQERLRIAPSGNVGIGTSTPERALDVNGSIRQTTYTTGLLSLNSGALSSFDWTHNLGYQPTLLLSLDQTGGDGAEYVTMSYEHLNNNTVRLRFRNSRGTPVRFTVRWIRVD